MTESTLTIWQKALAETGTRSTIQQSDINAVAAGATAPQEAFYCNTFYANVIGQALRAAHWNFAKKTDQLLLWKALPGTPENQSQPTQSGWDRLLYPSPPWTYAYAYPFDCIQVRTVLGQPQQVPLNPPIFSGTFQLAPPPISQKLPSGRFEVATDQFDGGGNLVGAGQGVNLINGVAVAVGGTGYKIGDIVFPNNTFTPTGYSAPIGIPATMIVTQIGGGGVVTALALTQPGYFPSSAIPTNPVSTSGGSGTGLTVNLTLVAYLPEQRVILTNLEQAIVEYTVGTSNENTWDPDFLMVVVMALAGKITIPLTGDKALARDKLSLANAMILEARLRDANEELTINDHIPDWIRTRGVGGGLGYEMYFYPFGPLFPISPLV